MDPLKKKLSDIRKLSILSVVLIVVYIALFITSALLKDSTIFNSDKSDVYSRSQAADSAFFLAIIASIFQLFSGVVIGYLILRTNWNQEKIKSEKLIWGILAILFFGGIPGLIFVSRANTFLGFSNTPEK